MYGPHSNFSSHSATFGNLSKSLLAAGQCRFATPRSQVPSCFAPAQLRTMNVQISHTTEPDRCLQQPSDCELRTFRGATTERAETRPANPSPDWA